MPVLRILLAVLSLTSLLPGQTPQGTGAAAPEIYMGRNIARTMHWQGAAWLIRQKREREESSLEMRANLGLKPGMVVCDMGAGNGYHSLPMAQVVGPSGKVYAVDIQPEMIEMLKERSAKAGINNIEGLLSLQDDPRLPGSSCDLIVLVDVYHEFSKPAAMLAAMRRALKPRGLICLVEFRAEDPTVPIREEHKMSRDQILKEMTANGLKLDHEYRGLPWQHMMFFAQEATQR